MKSRAQRQADNQRLDRAVAQYNKTHKNRYGTDKQYRAHRNAEKAVDAAMKNVSGWKRDSTWSKLKR